ncbi:hypothetical protein HK103_002792 [Boothiomyces macroporosus]|uniref:Nucleoporin Nup133/Nup155-like C-terminal domain-containing protein n=1 Tax=Boothiomyces macroporosus TaxID=261099 RepID=A0AAD5YBB7_9FUNG|nr:hypothetical protein HK103_002765 [Boothiomyces macroporosus]KAJ3262377.1 hypothetical protein HK103_002792 [Boothiomyces macroporosus]
MNEIMLQIFYISETSPDKARIIIEKCWDDIIKQKFRDAQFSKISPFDSLSDKIKELGLKFYPSDLVFPLLYLVNKLEQSSLDYYIKENSYSYGWVARSLLDVKIPFNLLFQVYQSIYESKLPPWSSNEAIAFLIHNILKLVQTWFDYIRSPATGFYERDEFPAREIDEVLSKYLSNLPMDNKSLSNEIQKLQSRLRSAF